MKSIKRGRAPSGMNAIGAVFAAIFGIVWTIMAVQMGAPILFPIFGVGFVLMGILQAVYSFKNATGKQRFSEFDVTEAGEEPDPWELPNDGKKAPTSTAPAAFCPYCGGAVNGEFSFCPKCGKQLP